MPLFFKRGSGTSINIDSDVARLSSTTFTAARKFSAPDVSNEQETRGVEVRSNDEHMIEQAASMKGTAIAAETIARRARVDLDSVRAQLFAVPGQTTQDARAVLPNKTEFDVASIADGRANILAGLLQSSLPILNTQQIADDFHKRVGDSVFQKKVDVVSPNSFNPIVPQLDGVNVEMDKNRGTIDCFFTVLRFSLPVSQVNNGTVKAIRIFRSTINNPKFQRGVPPVMTLRGMDRLSTLKMRSRSKGLDQMSVMEHRYRESGVSNAMDVLSPVDPQTNLRGSTNESDSFVDPVKNSSFTSAILPRSLSTVSSFLNPGRFGGLDPSIAEDLNVIRNIRSQDPSAGSIEIPRQFSFVASNVRQQGLLNQSQTSVLKKTGVGSIVVGENNKQEFREAAFFSLDKLKSKTIGDYITYEFLDETVSFGRGYKFYVVSVDKNMVESVRSQIVDVTIEGIRIPERPKRVFAYNVQDAISFNVIVDDQLVEKFEVFRRETDFSMIRQTRRISSEVSDVHGFNVNSSIVDRGRNNFIKMGECLNGTKGSGGTYYDRDIIPGTKYLYRIYSVDVFGNKSESPYEIEMFVPDRGSKPNELIKPSLTAEVDAKTGKARLTFKCSDSRVKSMFISRRDLTIGQVAFTSPSQVNFIKLGTPKAGEGGLHFEDVLLRGENKDVSWTGFFENELRGDITYIDQTVSLDHTYQYRVHGVDLYGNSTPYEICRPFLIFRRPLISAPVNLSAEVVQGPKFTVGGVKISWQDGNVDVSSEDRLGSRDKLSDTSTRTLYQVERRKVGEERWIEFPMVEDLSFFDPSVSMLGAEKPGFRPPVVETNQTYVYRVKALQTGSYVSNYGNFVEVFAALQIMPPSNFRVRSSDPKVKPFYVALNWDTPNDSGVVDKWEIERADVNNFAASRLNIKNPQEFAALRFRPHRVVFRESSRFRSQGQDRTVNFRAQPNSADTVFTGQHQFQDTSVLFGNTYFFRIRAVGVDGSVSSWVYRGMKLVEESVERIIDAVVPPDKKDALIETSDPIVIVDGGSPSQGGSFGFQPQFSDPVFIPPVTVEDPPQTPPVLVPRPVPTYDIVEQIQSVHPNVIRAREAKERRNFLIPRD